MGLCRALMAVTAAFAQSKPVIQFLATCGTIVMKIDPVKNAPVPAISGDVLLASDQGIVKYTTIEFNNLSNALQNHDSFQQSSRVISGLNQ